MISEFVRERRGYTQDELCRLLHCSELQVVPLISKLKEYGILKTINGSKTQRHYSDLSEEDIEIADVETNANKYLYGFTFVGVIVVAGVVLKCYPKYLLNVDEPKDELHQILKVLEKYNSKEQIIHMHSDSSRNQSFNLLAILLFLLKDYYDNGVYSNTEVIIEKNGSGEILWEKTITESFPLISNNRPLYPSILTKKRSTNEYDYFKRLHECILTRASRELKDAGLLELFDITEIDLSDETLDDFGEDDYILYQIERELNIQFNTRKQLVLKTIYTYIDHNGSLYDIDCLSTFGTNRFNRVWESVCASILDNKLETSIGALNLPKPLKAEYKGKRLIDLIERPLWTVTGNRADDTLIPDIVTINGPDFIIFDAKYYTAYLVENMKPAAQPGIESVTKQYMYQLAYQKFIIDHDFSSVKNCFLMPTDSKKVINKGEVSMEMLSSLGLQDIKVRFIPAQMAYDYYLTGRTMDVSELRLDK